MNTPITDNVVTNSVLETTIEGFHTFIQDESDPFYKQYVASWNQLYHDLEECDENNRIQFLSTLQAAQSNGLQIYERCRTIYNQLRKDISYFVSNLDKCAKKLDGRNSKGVIKIKKKWDQALKSNTYYNAVNYTHLKLFLTDLEKVKLNNKYKDLEGYISVNLNHFEGLIVKIARIFYAYIALDNAVSYAQLNGELIDCKSYIENEEYWNENLEWIPPIYRSIHELIIFGHFIDNAIKLRFLSLTQDERYSHQEAYDDISNELKALNLDVKELLPTEAKSLSDRANRFKKKRLKELACITRN